MSNAPTSVVSFIDIDAPDDQDIEVRFNSLMISMLSFIERAIGQPSAYTLSTRFIFSWLFSSVVR